MSFLTDEQLAQIAKVFGLKPKVTFPVRDGVVSMEDKVWWRCETGPEHVDVRAHLHNLKEFPQAYQLAQPQTKIVYLDAGL